MTDPSPTSARAADAALTLLRRADADDYRGPDPYDGLWFPWPRPLVAGVRRRQVFMQLHARSPVDFRPLYRRRHPLIPKALGIFGSVGMLLATGETLDHATRALELLDDDRASGDRAWGYHWDMQTRWSFYPAGSPNVVVTAFGAGALHAAAGALRREHWSGRARQAAEWVRDELLLDEGFFAYHPGSTVLIHNASLLGAVLVDALLGERSTVARAVELTLAGQRPDGAWPYGAGDNLGFVDNFHTGYVLECLARLRHVDSAVDDAIRRGTEHWLDHFFLADGTATLWPDQRYPEDAHAAGTAMTTLSRLVGEGFADAETLDRVTAYTLARMFDGTKAIARRYRFGPTRVRYLRWSDAHMALGFANAARTLGAEITD